MNVNVRYDNDHYGDHETYTTTLAELLETFWFLDESGALTRDVASGLETARKSIIRNGHATTTVTLPHTQYRECICDVCSDIDWDAPNANCGLPNRDCCGCHDGYHTAGCLEETTEMDKLFWLARGATEWTPKELRTQSAEPKPGDTLEDSTCVECLTEDVTVTYQRTESWGDSNAPVGKVEFWLCGTCASSDDRT